MWEEEQVDYWETQSNGYIAPPLPALNDNPIWTSDPKVTPFRDVLKRSLDDGYSGKLSRASAVVMGNFVVASSGAGVATQIGFQPLFQANDFGDRGGPGEEGQAGP
jgi:multiple sugar transport system substrate-binding protein